MPRRRKKTKCHCTYVSERKPSIVINFLNFKLTPLIEAARDGNSDEVQILATSDCVNDVSPGNYWTPLAFAAAGGSLDAVYQLIIRGARTDVGNMLPLAAAGKEGHYNLIAFLLLMGADINASNVNTNDSALTLASENGHTHVVEFLLKYGAKLEHKDSRGRTPLMRASRAGHLETVELLLKKGANINSVSNKNEFTPLSMACMAGHVKMVELLLSCGANANHLLRGKRNMLMVAASGGHVKCARVIADHIAKYYI